MATPNPTPKSSRYPFNGNGRVHNGTDGTFNTADDTCEFIEGLVERCADNPGYVFAPEVISRLSSLKQEDRLAFETLRVSLKKMGFRLALWTK